MLSNFLAGTRQASRRAVQASSSSSSSSIVYASRVTCRFVQTALENHEDDEENAVLSGEQYRAKHEIKVSAACPKPFQNFEDCGFSRELMQALKRQGYPAPTPIQAQSWAIAREHTDIVSVAKTGSGKTMGFLVPAIEQILESYKANGPPQSNRYDPCRPKAIVLAPTRELAQQIGAEAHKVASLVGLKTAVLFGGASKSVQGNTLRKNPEIVVATPGRLNDFLNEGMGFPPLIDVSNTKYCVLDEADRMLDMGFEPQIKDILRKCPMPGERQTLMFTATWPKKVQSIAKNFTGGKVEHIMVGKANEKLTASSTIKQVIHIMREGEKLDKLKELLSGLNKGDQVMIFSGTKRCCDQIDRHLGREGVRVAGAIHGDKSQRDRDRVLGNFRRGNGDVLVATDVAARGIDVPNVKLVVVYDFPGNTEDYIHRIGRTGRAGKPGLAHTFLTESSAAQTPELVQIMRDSGNEVEQDLERIANAQKSPIWSQNASDRGGGRRGGSYGAGRSNRYGQSNDRFGGNNRHGGNDRYGGNNRFGGNNRNGGNNDRRGGRKDPFDTYGGHHFEADWN